MQFDSSEFPIGSLVTEPFLGPCLVDGVSQEDILGTTLWFYELKPQGDNAPLVKVPASQMSSRGIRPVMSEAEMSNALSVLEEADDISQEPPSQRMRHWVDRLRSGRHSGPTNVLRQLRRMQQNGVKLTPKELSLEQTVQVSVRQEIACAMKISASQAGLRLNSALETKNAGAGT